MLKKIKNVKKPLDKQTSEAIKEELLSGKNKVTKEKISRENIAVNLEFQFRNRKMKEKLGLKLDVVNHQGSPLYWATLFANFEAVCYFLTLGANISEIVNLKPIDSDKFRVATLYEHIIQRFGKECIKPILDINSAWLPLILGGYIRYYNFVQDLEIVQWLEKYKPLLPDGGFLLLDGKHQQSFVTFLVTRNFFRSFEWICRQLDDDKWPRYFEKKEFLMAHAAVLAGYHEIIIVMAKFAKGRELCLSKDKDNATPLMLAKESKQTKMVELLEKIEKGDSLEDLNLSDHDVPIKGYIDFANFQCLESFFKKNPEKINQELVGFDFEGEYIKVTPLYYATMIGMTCIVTWLCEKGAVVTRSPGQHFSALSVAIKMNNLNMLRLLVERDKAILDEKDKNGDGVFFFAVRGLAVEAARFLYDECGLDPFVISKKTRLSALTEAMVFFLEDKSAERKEMVYWLWSLYQKKEHFYEVYNQIESPLFLAFRLGVSSLVIEMMLRIKSLGLPQPLAALECFISCENEHMLRQVAPILMDSLIDLESNFDSDHNFFTQNWCELKKWISEEGYRNAALWTLLMKFPPTELHRKILMSLVKIHKPIPLKEGGSFYLIDIFVSQKRMDLVECALEFGADLTDHVYFESDDNITALQHIEKNYKEPEWQKLIKTYKEDDKESTKERPFSVCESESYSGHSYRKKQLNLFFDNMANKENVKRPPNLNNRIFKMAKPTWFGGSLIADKVERITINTNAYFFISRHLLNGPDAEKIKKYFCNRSLYFGKKCLHKMDLDACYEVVDKDKIYYAAFTHEMVKRNVMDRLVVVKIAADNVSASLYCAIDYFPDGFHQSKDAVILRDKKRVVDLSFVLADNVLNEGLIACSSR